MFIYAKNRVGVPVQVNVIGTIIFLVAVGAVLPDDRSRAPPPASAGRGGPP